jgi:hypothetical protein
MNEPSNAPIMTPPPERTGWLPVWTRALTQPREETFTALAASPNAKARTGYLWYFLGSLVSILLASLVQGAVMGPMMEQFGLDSSQFGSGEIGTILITAICGAPIGAVVSTAFFAIGVLIVQWIAGMFGGRGTNDQLVYTMSAILTPYLFISGLLTLLTAIPYVGFCFGLVSALAGIYILVLEVMAVKGVNQFGWGPAIGSLFIPVLVIGFLCACLIAGAFLLLGPVVGNVFDSINQSLVP